MRDVAAARPVARRAPYRRARRRAELWLAVTSLVLTAVLGELMTRLFIPAPLPWRYPQLRYRSDTVLGFALAPDQRAFTADKAVTINARGLRGPEVSHARTPGRQRILVVGDSIAFGYGVNDADVLSVRLARRLEADGLAAEVVNAGVPAYNPDQEVAYVEEEGVRYRPDWIVVAARWDDINDKSGVHVSPEGQLESAEDEAIGPLSEAIELAAETPTGFMVRNALKRSLFLYGSLEGMRAVVGRMRPDAAGRLRDDVLEGRETPTVLAGWRRMDSALGRLAGVGSTHAFRTLLVAFPIPVAVTRSFPEDLYPVRMSEMADHRHLPLLDLETSFRARAAAGASLFIPYDGDHPNAAGHDLAAAEIAKFLEAAEVASR